MGDLVALLTDFGEEDWFVSAMKAVVRSINPHCQIVDITHQIPPQDVRTGAYVLAQVLRDFPAGTVVVAVVDPGVGTERSAIAGEIDGRLVVAPDNGLVSWCLAEARYARFVRLDRPEFFRKEVSHTFHGRDVFAPVAAHLSAGRKLVELGSPCSSVQTFAVPRPSYSSEEKLVRGEVVHVDRFGNLITNLTNRFLDECSAILLERRKLRIVGTYAEGKKGEVVALPGSGGTVEIAAREAPVVRIAGARVGSQVVLKLGR